MNVLISCIGRRGYLARFFREAGAQRVIGTSNSVWTPGFVDCDKTFLLPDIVSNHYSDRLLKLCLDENVDVLLSTLDLDIHYLSEHCDKFAQHGIATFIVDRRVSEICFDKLETVEFLQSCGFDQPATFADVESARREIAAGNLQFPLFVKPRFGFGSKNLFIANNDKQMEVFFDYSANMIIQEKLAGTEYSFDLLNSLEGEVKKVVVKQKVLMRSGETDQAVTIQSDQLTNYAVDLGQKLKHVGPLDVDLFWDDGKAVVLEMNPRFGGGYPVSHMAGANYPELMLKMANKDSFDAGSYQSGIRMMKAISSFECSHLVDSVVDLRDEQES